MSTLAWLLILVGFMVTRQVSKGRANSIRVDAHDLVLGFLTGDTAKVSEVLNRPPSVDLTSAVSPEATTTGNGDSLAVARSLAAKASNKYRWGATGPDAYDCSGLVWRALRETGVYNGVRFTSATFGVIAPKFASEVMTPAAGDIVVWPGHHMGFVTGPGKMFSALNAKRGIIDSPISWGGKDTPKYWRITVSDRDARAIDGRAGVRNAS